MTSTWSLVVALAFSVVTPQSLGAQTRAADLIDSARVLVDELSIDSALVLLRRALEPSASATRNDEVRALVLMGIAHLILDQREAARRAFQRALARDPEVSVDSLAHLSSDLIRVFGTERARVSSLLRVTGGPPGGTLRVGERLVGSTPFESRTVSDTTLLIEVRQQAWRQGTHVYIPQNSLVQVRFDTPLDTLPWPVLRSRLELAKEIQLPNDWHPSTAPPAELKPPSKYPPWTAVIIAGVFGLAGVALAADIRPRCEIPPACSPVVGFLVGASLSLPIGIPLDNALYKTRLKGHERRTAAARTRWEQAERQQWVNRQLDTEASREEARINEERSRIMRENDRIRTRNREPQDPRVIVERLP